MMSIGSNGPEPNYLLIGLVLGTLAGFLVGAVVMLQIGQQTSSAVQNLRARLLGDNDRVRFELLSQ
jgi:hypothetical protein